MTRKDFELIARVVRTISNEDARLEAAQQFAVALAATNSRFNIARFIEACGITYTATARRVA